MTQATDLLGARPVSHGRVLGAVSAAHFVSHYYILLLAPLLPFVRAEYNVSYTEIALAIAAFNVVSATLQTPAGFLVDKLGARPLLIGGLLIGGSAFMVAGLVDSFWVLVAMFAFAGIGNTVYHPADYALLSQHVPHDRIGHAFSIHSFAGMMGSAVAPVTLLTMQSLWGWRGAFIGAGLLGFAIAALLLAVRAQPPAASTAAPARPGGVAPATGWRLLLSTPILLNLVFFMLLSMMSGGIYNYSAVALGALYGTPLTTANVALSMYLLLSAIGVLAGGYAATHTSRHAMVAVLALIAIICSSTLIANVDLGSTLIITAMAFSGFFFGFIMPSRDMIVRAITPPGSFGKVFGFVTTGFNIGGIIAPLMFGAIMDHGSPQFVFMLVATFGILAMVLVAAGPKRTVAG